MIVSNPHSLLFFASTVMVSVSAEDYPMVDDAECDCFLTDGSSEAYFKNQLFFDFRNLPQYAGVPAVIDNVNETTSTQVTSDYFSSSEWTKQWTIQAWNNTETKGKEGSDATLLLINSPNNVYVEANDDDDSTGSSASITYLTMRTARLASFQSAAEMESTSGSYQFLSVRMYARTIGSAGACTAMFTYRDGVARLADVQEADTEFLTVGPRNRVHYTNQPSFTVEGDEVEDTTFTETLPHGLEFGDWAVHRIDWTPGYTTWFVDGEEVKRSDVQVPRDASRVLFNAWSDGGSWTGEMEESGEAFLQVQWIEMVYNSSDKENDGRKRRRRSEDTGLLSKVLHEREDEQCNVVCSIDESDHTGRAVKLSRAASLVDGANNISLLVPLLAALSLILQ